MGKTDWKQWTSEKAAEQAAATYADYKKTKGFEDVGYFLEAYVVQGGAVTANITHNDRIDVTEIVVSLNDDIMKREGTTFKTKTASSVYYLDFFNGGDWTWGTSHPTGTAGTDYLTVAEVTTDSNGLVAMITDQRGHVGGFLLKDEYGLENYATTAQLADKARKFWFDIRDYEAVGDDTADDSASMQSAIDAANAAGGGTVFFPFGVYRAKNVNLYDNIRLLGVYGTVTLKLLDGVDGQLLVTPGQNDGVVLKNVEIDGIIFDGNKDNSAKVEAASAVAINNCDGVTIRDCVFQNATGYGLAFQAYPGGPIDGNQKNLHIENCRFLNNGDGVGGDTHDGLDLKYCENATFINCFASGNKDKGINVRGINVSVIGCVSVLNVNDGYLFQGNHNVNSLPTDINVSNCYARNNGQSGFYIADGSSSATESTKVRLVNVVSESNGTYGIYADAGSNKVVMQVSNAETFSNADHGIYIRVPVESAIIQGSSIHDNGGSGIYTGSVKTQISDCQINSNARYGVEETGTRTVISGATSVQGNTLGNFLFASNKRYMIGRGVIDYDIGTSASGDIIASASTITLPEGGDVFFITGTMEINTITASRRGRIIVLQFTGSVTINHATGNIRLSGGTNISALNRHTLTLMSDGTSWLEMAYSANA